MAIPSVQITVNSGGLGIITPGLGSTPCPAGWSSAGPAGQLTIIGQGNISGLTSEFGTGPMVEAAACLLAGGIQEVVCLRIFDGTMGNSNHVGSGTGTITVSGSPTQPYGTGSSAGSTGPIIQISLGGAFGTAEFIYSTDGGISFTSPQLIPSPSTSTFAIPGTGLTFEFVGTGSAWVTSDTYTFPIITSLGAAGAITQYGPNFGAAQGEGLLTNVSTDAAATFTSTTSGDGVIFTAVTPGPAGGLVSIQFLAPSGGSTTCTVDGYNIIVQPQASCTNTQLIAAWTGGGSNFPAALALATVALKAGGSDDVVTTAQTFLSGGTISNPQDNYSVIVLIMTTGVIGAGQFSFSMDGGLTFSANTTIPSGAQSNLGGGVLIDWANTGGAGVTSGFVAGDTYRFTTTPPAITTTDLTNNLTNVAGSGVSFDWMHICARPTSASGAAAVFNVLATIGPEWFAANRYAFFVMDTPADTSTNSIDAALITAFANLASDYVCVGAGDCNITSPISGNEYQRCASWEVSIRGSQTQIGTDLAAVASGALAGVADILRDESMTPGLDAAGFSTLRTWRGLSGFFITNANIFSSSVSNIKYFQHRRLIDVACELAYKALLNYSSADIRVNSSTGTIYGPDADAIEKFVAGEVATETVEAGQCTAISILVNRTNDILADDELLVQVGVLPFAYPKMIAAVVGLINPALSTPTAP